MPAALGVIAAGTDWQPRRRPLRPSTHTPSNLRPSRTRWPAAMGAVAVAGELHLLSRWTAAVTVSTSATTVAQAAARTLQPLQPLQPLQCRSRVHRRLRPRAKTRSAGPPSYRRRRRLRRDRSSRARRCCESKNTNGAATSSRPMSILHNRAKSSSCKGTTASLRTRGLPGPTFRGALTGGSA
ncbi:hypothetical protein T492DRAFT_1047955 [Pavlovales sp. CCMP2436]|nr:hypothetical protein T492DRAFT_1047955 [Pavlovales sp. CCMP2436]